MDLSVIPYITADAEDGDVIHSKRAGGGGASTVKYKECMKNHAASLGGHANDGCGEFMPHPDPAKPLSCAACGCHRNFHRRESPGGHHTPPPMLMYNAGPTTILWDRKQAAAGALRAPPVQRRVGPDLGDFEGGDNEECNDDSRSETPERGDLNSFQVVGAPVSMMRSSSKRFRTRFTAEQKERMYEFAERVGWRMNKQDEALMNQFCTEVGVKRNVLKVWMHNNKNGRRRDGPAMTPPLTSPVAAATPQPLPPPAAATQQQAAGI